MKTIHDFIEAKERKEKITMISTYDYWSAKLCQEAEVDCILVGDSLGMVIQGKETTLPVTLEEMIYHAKAVKRGAPETFIVVDMPFLSYQVSKEHAVENAGRIMKETGCHAVKIEGGEEIAPVVERLVSVGIPVMGHLGLTPQSVHAIGGYKVQGKTEEQQKKIIKDAQILQNAGAFAVVLEVIPSKLAKEITDILEIPTIGIGAGKETDGQVLVFHDMIGIFEKSPKFVKRYLEGGKLIKEALFRFNEEVKKGIFPNKEHTYDWMIKVERDLKKAEYFLKKGKIIVAKTDTLYGILADALNKEIVEKVYEIKGRRKDKPYIVLIPDISFLKLFDADISKEAKKLLQYRGITVIVPLRNPEKFQYLHKGKNEIAFRIPDNKELIKLMKKINTPLIAPSANLEGKPPPKNIQEAVDYFGDKIDLYVDSGEIENEKPSTIVKIENGEIKILREGNVSYNKIKEILEGNDVKNL